MIDQAAAATPRMQGLAPDASTRRDRQAPRRRVAGTPALALGVALAFAIAGSAAPAANAGEPLPRVLYVTQSDGGDGWRTLFDGTSTAAWRGYKRDALPDGWQVVDGALARVDRGGDIITVEQFENFELRFEWQVEVGGNSGVFFGVTEEVDGPVWHSGPEFQILHNAGHRDGQAPITSAGSNYAVHPPAADVTRPVGEWNTSRVVVDRGRVEHWMNGKHLLTYRLGDADWQARVEASKFAPLPRYGRVARGHIAIQDHGDPVRFRNIRIRELD